MSQPLQYGSPHAPMLQIPRGCMEQMAEHIRQHAPNEACGFLAGFGMRVTAVYPIPNAAEYPDISFLMEPRAQLQALLEIDKRTLDLAAIYHSHPPGSRTDPSPKDLLEAAYPGVLTLIMVPDHDGSIRSLRVFEIEDQQAFEVACQILHD